MKINMIQAVIVMNLSNTTPQRGIWRPDLADRVDTPESTLYGHLETLQEKGLVDSYTRKKSRGVGRSRVYWYLTKKGQKALKKIQQEIRIRNE